MKNTRIIWILFVAALFASCSPSMDAVWEKKGYSTRHFDNLAVIVISKSLEARQSTESAIISEIQKEHPNINTTSGVTLFPPNHEAHEMSEAEIEAVLSENKVDGVLTVSVVDSYQSQEMVNNGPDFYPYYYRVGPYIYSTYDYMYNSPTYETAQNYIIESNLYDLSLGDDKTELLVWKGQDTISDPSSISSSARSYAKNLIGYLDDKNLLK